MMIMTKKPRMSTISPSEQQLQLCRHVRAFGLRPKIVPITRADCVDNNHLFLVFISAKIVNQYYYKQEKINPIRSCGVFDTNFKMIIQIFTTINKFANLV